MRDNTKYQVRSANVYPLTGPLVQSFRTALGDHDELNNLILGIVLNDGTKGFGEAALAEHISGEKFLQTQRNLQKAADDLLGRDVRDYLDISWSLRERFPDNPAMRAAVETAILDALTRALRLPLWRFFGAKCLKLSSDITIVIAGLEETTTSVTKFYRQGFRQFKVKIGRDFDLDIARVCAVKANAPKSKIFLDANQGYSAAEILEFIKTLRRQKVTPALLEQPVPREDWEGLKRVSRLSGVPVCADESARSVRDVIAIIREKAAPVINIKIMKCGMVEAREIMRVAQAAGLDLMIGGMLETSLAMTASAHLAAGMGSCKYIDLDTPFFIKGDVRRNPTLSSQGVYDLTHVKAGIGVRPRDLKTS